MWNDVKHICAEQPVCPAAVRYLGGFIPLTEAEGSWKDHWLSLLS